MVRIGMFLGDRYEILEKIGSGGMAEVFKGKDHKLNRFVAVKVLKDEFVEDRNFVRKFKEEAQAAAALAHPVWRLRTTIRSYTGISSLRTSLFPVRGK